MKTRTSPRMKWQLGSLLLAASTLSAFAFAADEKVIPGVICNTQSSKTLFDSGEMRLPNGGAIFCPLIRDTVQGTLTAVYIRIHNHSTSGTGPSCTVFSRQATGSSFDVTSKSQNSSGEFSMSMNMSGFTEYDNGSYSSSCALHGNNDGIRSIRYREE